MSLCLPKWIWATNKYNDDIGGASESDSIDVIGSGAIVEPTLQSNVGVHVSSSIGGIDYYCF